MKKLSILGLILLLLQVFLPIGPANAEENSTDVVFGTKIKNQLTEDEDVDVYKFTLDKPSRVSWNLKSYIDGSVEGEILDSDEVTTVQEHLFEATPSTPNIWSSYADLEAGTYYFKVKKYWFSNDTGNYELIINASSYSNNDREWNNSALESQSIQLGTKQIGLISWNDNVDVYKFTLDKASRITWNFKSFIDGNVDAELVDSNEVDTIQDKELTSSSTAPNLWASYEDLEPGTYYFKVKRYEYSLDTGKYELTINSATHGNTDTVWNNGVEDATNINPDGKTNVGLISWNDDTDYYKFEIKKPSKVSLSLKSFIDRYVDIALINKNGVSEISSKQLAGSSSTPGLWSYSTTLSPGIYFVKISRYDYSVDTGKYELQVKTLDTTPPNAPKVKSVSNLGKVITGTSEANSSIVVYNGSKQLASATTNSKGEYKLSLKPVKKNTRLTIYAYDAAKNRSKATTIIIKK